MYQHDQHDDTVLIGPNHNHVCYKDHCGFHSSTGRETIKTTEMREKVTIVTRFITSDGTTDGDLTRFVASGPRTALDAKDSNANFTALTGISLTFGLCDAQTTLFGSDSAFMVGP